MRISFKRATADVSLPLRKAIFWIHLVCGVVAGGVILMMSVTGVLLTYQKQLTEWADREYWVAPAVEGQQAPISALVEQAYAYDADADVSRVTLWSNPEAPAAVAIGGDRTLYLDPSTAEVRGENRTGVRGFLSWNVRVHRWFGATGEARSTARAITGWSNLVFLFLVLSGLYLWVPVKWSRQHLRPMLVLNTKARGKARDFNWHHFFGFWMAIPLALVVGSATVISFPWASDLAYRVVGDQPPQRGARAAPRPAPPTAPGSAFLGAMPSGVASVAVGDSSPIPFDVALLDPLLPSASERVDGWRTIAVTVPDEAGTPVSVRIDRGWGGEPAKRYTVQYDAATGREVAFEGFADQSRGRRFRTFLRFAHTGEFFGIWGQTLAGFASLAAVLLVWSGLALAWRRLVLRPLARRAAA